MSANEIDQFRPEHVERESPTMSDQGTDPGEEFPASRWVRIILTGGPMNGMRMTVPRPPLSQLTFDTPRCRYDRSEDVDKDGQLIYRLSTGD